jgi:plastocyanin
MRRLLTTLSVGALAMAGCGSSSQKDEAPAAATKAPKATSASAPAGDAVKATIKDFTFAPKSVTVKAGGSVTWTNKDAANHNVSFDDKSVKGIGNLREGQDGKVTFAKAGSYAYVCTYHPGMEGTVVVK